MTAAHPTLTAVAAAAEEAGLRLRGALACAPDDQVPPQPDGRASRTLVLLGNLGGSLWPDFAAGPEFADGGPDPMNRWSARVVGSLAERFRGLALFPFGGPPYHPFLRWAQKAEGLRPSPLGMLIHPVYGLWHAYRGALALGEALALPDEPPPAHPCEACAEKPCLSACPVDAFSESGYDVPACTDHLRAAAGADCLTGGCLARRACPVGREHVYAPPQAAFHMRAFLTAQSIPQSTPQPTPQPSGTEP
ncbi:MAG TPA: 4Fe-4S dicluster domain-containing protein [Kiloniellaceae bacterium]|nr:4Fe-4S dicluster domain-containing protein [Kiloniellaceae bacterium]